MPSLSEHEQGVIGSGDNAALLLECQRLGRTGYTIVDYVAGRVVCSDSVFDIRRLARRETTSLAEALELIHPEDRSTFQAAEACAIAERRDFEADVRVLRGDGSVGWERRLGHPRYDERGNFVAMLFVLRDITEEKRAEIALRESRAMLLESQRIGRTGYVHVDFATGRSYWSETLFEIRRIPPRPYFTFEESIAIVDPDDLAKYMAVRNAAIAARQDFQAEWRVTRGDGSTGWESGIGHLRFDDKGNCTGILLVLRDNTEEKLAALALEKKERDLSAIMDNAPLGIYLKDRSGRYLRTNRKMDEFGGWRGTPTAGKSFSDLLANELVETIRRSDREVLENGKFVSIDTPTFSGRDDYTHATLMKFPVRDEAGNIVGIAGFITNITERHRAEEALRQREADIRAIVDNAPLAIFLKDRERRFRFVNRCYADWFRVAPDRLYGKRAGDVLPGTIGRRADESDRDILERRQVAVSELFPDMVEHKPDFESGHVTKFPILDESGDIVGIAGFIENVTARKRAEAALRKSEELLRAAAQAAGVGIYDHDNVTDAIYWSQEQRANYGVSADEIITLELFLAHVHPDDRDAIAAAVRNAHDPAGDGRFDVQHRILRADGSVRWMLTRGRTLFDGEGSGRHAVRTIGAVLDVTDRIRAADERALLESQLLQAQKMEAVGQLTGGIAHDFNNLLGVVSGNLELLDERLPADAAQRVLLDRALTAVDRGATLTRSLLAFARKQPLSPVPLDANRLISETAELFRRPLGERIELVTVTSGGLWLCEADPVQLQAAVLNLLVNARDAMPDGGKITLETANARLDDEYAATHAEVAPGLYVLIAVSDSGSGMPDEVAQHAFEPFFTTKGPGAGSGLGLSMVYGFVKQSGGHIKIYSEVGKGTSIKIYLPRAASTAGVVVAPPLEPTLRSARGETILLVEDDEEFRATIAMMLREAGYAVIEAATGDAALLHLRGTTAARLLLTDVIIPGTMKGVELMRAATAINPELVTIFMSGYTENSIIHHGRLDPGVQLLQKPFRRVDLLNKVRRALGP